VHVTAIVQLAPAARVLPQLLVWEKLLDCVPLMPIVVIDTRVLPMFVIVMF